MLFNKLEAQVNGAVFENFPSIEKGKEIPDANQNSDNAYFAFGSDDIGSKKTNKININMEESLKNGKEMFQKFGSFLGNSVKNLVKPKEGEIQNEQSTESPSVRKSDKPNDWKVLSSKIGQGFMRFGVA